MPGQILHDHQRPQRSFYILNQARTCSNLFIKIIVNHPQLDYTHYPFDDAFMWGPDRLVRRRSRQLETAKNAISDEERSEMTYRIAFEKMMKFVDDVHLNGKTPLIKEGVYFVIKPQVVADNLPKYPRTVVPTPIVDPTLLHDFSPQNPTVLPDSILATLSPVLLIRHPYRQIPSFYRASKKSLGAKVDDEDFPMNVTFRWTKLIFDFYKDLYSRPEYTGVDHGDKWPIIIDGDELVNDPQQIMEKFCETTGLDPQGCQYVWETGPVANVMDAAFRGAIASSTGVVKNNSKHGPVVIEREVKYWVQEFGSDIARVMEKYAKEAMPDYEYLLQHRLH